MTYSINEINIANKTSRNTGAVGKKALVPRLVAQIANEDEAILDFGAGKSAAHAVDLAEQGFNVTAYEFGDNVVPGLHDKDALTRSYEIVYASNVLNVQSNYPMLQETLTQIAYVTRLAFVFNFPKSPRKLPKMTEEILLKFVKDHFPVVKKRKVGSGYVFMAFFNEEDAELFEEEK